MKVKYFILAVLIISCKRELDIIEFSEDYNNYESELRIEALILPADSTAIVRIDRSFLLTDTVPYTCIDNDYGTLTQSACELYNDSHWYGLESDEVANCGNWNPLIHDVGSDGIASLDVNGNGNYEEFGDIAPDTDGTEKNGLGDCGEPNIDNYVDTLPLVHESSCSVSVTKIESNQNQKSCNFHYQEDAGYFFNPIEYTGDKSGLIIDNIETVSYGAYVPFNCENDFWNDYEAEYSFSAECDSAGFGTIKSKEPINISKPVVFFLEEDSLITECLNYNCLLTSSSIHKNSYNDTLYFGRYSPKKYIYWASILPVVEFQAVQYMYDEEYSSYYYHGHAAVSTPEFHSGNVAVTSESIITEYYDGYGNGIWDKGEIYSDDNNNGQWDEEEYFIDISDNEPEIDEFYYEISTFSESYRNYYYYSDLNLNDELRSNLRDLEENVVLGAFGSMTVAKINFRIIDCRKCYTCDLMDSPHESIEKRNATCNDATITHSVCEWHDSYSLQPCDNYNGPICLPVDFSTEYCE